MEFSQFKTNALMEITSRPDLVFVRGQGSWLEDHAGKRYLDFVQGWAVNTLGHCAPEMQKALLDQSKLLMNPSPAFYNLPSIELAERLTGASVFDRVFFANSGGEANEGAIKLARKWGQVNKNGAYKIITMNHASTAARWPPCPRPASRAGTRCSPRRSKASPRPKSTTWNPCAS